MLVLSTRSEVDNTTKEKVMKEKEVQESVSVFNGIEMRISSLDDIWMTQKQIAQMFDTSKQNVGQHIKAFLKELDDEQVSSVVKKSFTTEKNGRHEQVSSVVKQSFFYNHIPTHIAGLTRVWRIFFAFFASWT